MALVAGVKASKRKIHQEKGHRGEFLDPKDYRKEWLAKSNLYIPGQTGPWVPQVCPKGPKFLGKRFSFVILS